MRVEVMQHFGLTVPLSQAGYYETAHHKDLMKDVRGAINEGRLIAICGVIGSGKTVMLRRLQQVHQFMHNDVLQALGRLLGQIGVEPDVA